MPTHTPTLALWPDSHGFASPLHPQPNLLAVPLTRCSAVTLSLQDFFHRNAQATASASAILRRRACGVSDQERVSVCASRYGLDVALSHFLPGGGSPQRAGTPACRLVGPATAKPAAQH